MRESFLAESGQGTAHSITGPVTLPGGQMAVSESLSQERKWPVNQDVRGGLNIIAVDRPSPSASQEMRRT
jgi:hypothetical protein